MTTPTTSYVTCVNCDRTEAEVPLIAWRYQGRDLTICSECLPVLIHHRARLMAKLEGKAPEGDIPEMETGDHHHA